MKDVTLVRLYVLRATYLFVAVGLAFMIWPRLLAPPPNIEHMRSVTWSLLGAVGLLAVIGIRYPLQMLPLLLFELVWKTVWVLIFGLPLWRAGALSPAMSATLSDCLISFPILLLAIPWPYVFAHYVRKPGDRWRRLPNVAH